ncbi:MAG: methyltransferase [Pseudomonadota bacterium]
MTAEPALTDDAFLDGRLRLLQPRRGYRAATDPILLAAACPAERGMRVLDIGCGVGTAGLALAARVPGIVLTGLEIQPDYAALAARNAERNGIDMRVVVGDLTRMPGELRAERFDLVLTNPPYFDRDSLTSPDPGRDVANREGVPLPDWIDAGLRRLEPGGTFAIIHRTERLGDMLSALSGRAGACRVLPLQARSTRPAQRCIVTARKGARGPLTLLPPFILHEGEDHPGDFDHMTEAARAVLRGDETLQMQP